MNTDHHATLLRVDSPRDFLQASRQELAIQEQWIVSSDSIGVEEVRGLIVRAYQRPDEGDKQLLVVCTDFITYEAQNALLKVLEEPPTSTNFLFVVPLDLLILPTLTSRFKTVDSVVAAKDQEEVLTDFLKLSFGERITFIDTKLKANDISWQRAMKRGLIARISGFSKVRHEQLSDFEFVARSLLTRGASNKMLLEHVALLLPVS